jgi:hypothetical protein
MFNSPPCYVLFEYRHRIFSVQWYSLRLGCGMEGPLTSVYLFEIAFNILPKCQPGNLWWLAHSETLEKELMCLAYDNKTRKMCECTNPKHAEATNLDVGEIV